MKKPALLLTVGIIFIVALGLRLYRFAPIWPGAHYTDAGSALPPGLQLDEAFNDLLALRFLRSGMIVPHFAIDQGIAAAHIYLTALVMRLAALCLKPDVLLRSLPACYRSPLWPGWSTNYFTRGIPHPNARSCSSWRRRKWQAHTGS